MATENHVVTHKAILTDRFKALCIYRAILFFIFFWRGVVYFTKYESDILKIYTFLCIIKFLRVCSFISQLNSCLAWKYPAHLVYLEFFTGYSNYSCLHSIISNSRMEEACIVLTTVLIFVYPSNSYLGIHNKL